MISFKVSIPTTEGFVGRQCSAAACDRYFRVRVDDAEKNLFCPYCGEQAAPYELLTADQRSHVREAAVEQAKEHALGMVDAMMRDLERSFRGSKVVRFKAAPLNYRARTVPPKYEDRRIDSQLTCPDCGVVFQVDGIFGHCPACRHESLLIYDADLSVIRNELEATLDPRRALRRAYTDLVSTFEIFCRKRARALGDDNARFQELSSARRFFKDFGVDILGSVSVNDQLTIRRIFQKRHAYEHSGGVADDKYIRLIPEDAALLGQQLPLSIQEFESGARVVRICLDIVSRLHR